VLVALAPGAVGGRSNLSVPVDAGDVSAETGAMRQKTNGHIVREAHHVIMTVKLKERAMARPKCMPMSP
jgi:hypothetical protein